MKMDEKKQDFPDNTGTKLYAGCCCCSSSCCCCLFWPGAFIGAGLGAISQSDEYNKVKHQPEFKAAMHIARKWYWTTFFVPALIPLVFFLLYIPRLIDDAYYVISLLGMPVINFLLAAIVCSKAIKTRVADEGIRKIIRNRNWGLFFGSLIGYIIGLALTFVIFKV